MRKKNIFFSECRNSSGFIEAKGTTEDFIKNNTEFTYVSTKRVPQVSDRNSMSFGRSGHILSRTTVAHRILRKWQNTFWIHLLPSTIIVFQSEEDFQKWASNESRFGKIMLKVDFNTLAISPRKIKDQQCREFENYKAPATKLISRIHKYTLGEVKAINRGEKPLYTCKLERLSSVGVDLVGSFASDKPTNLRTFRRAVHQCIKAAQSQNHLKSKKRGILVSDSVSETTCACSTYESVVQKQ